MITYTNTVSSLINFFMVEAMITEKVMDDIRFKFQRFIWPTKAAISG